MKDKGELVLALEGCGKRDTEESDQHYGELCPPPAGSYKGPVLSFTWVGGGQLLQRGR